MSFSVPGQVIALFFPVLAFFFLGFASLKAARRQTNTTVRVVRVRNRFMVSLRELRVNRPCEVAKGLYHKNLSTGRK
jgi:hypothetical protein